MAKLFLGLDSSTQSLSAVVVDHDAGQVVWEHTVNYDADLPAYGTVNGVLRDADPRVVHAPPLMWAEALDRMFADLREAGVPTDQIVAVSGSGQQHGSVYLNGTAPDALKTLDPAQDLKANLAGVLSRPTSPVWMDSSTGEECREISEALGGMEATAEATGSTAFERFTGPQIRKFFKQDPEGYEQTEHIALVSSFMASILAGRVAPIDHGDGAGMHLMDIRDRAWHGEAMAATAPGLTRRLPPLAAAWQVIGPVSSYFVQRYGLSPDAQAVVWSGDNPNSVIGLGLVLPGMVAVSLGTSDTCFGVMEDCHTDPHGEGHVFGSPTGDYMTLICFMNGSLARQRIRDDFGLDWEGFSNALRCTEPGNRGRIMLPYFEPEIVPKVLNPGVHRFGLEDDDLEGNCRAVVEAQMVSMRNHRGWMGEPPSRIYATGGASANRDILQIMADVNQCPVLRTEITNSAGLGAALRAVHAWRHATGRSLAWEEIVAGFTDPVPDSEIQPRPETAAVYDTMAAAYAERERAALLGMA